MRFLPTIFEPVYPAEGSLKTGRGYAWTPRELQVLRERYIAEGLVACEALLPVRGRNSIMNKAKDLGLRRQRVHAEPQQSNDMLDAHIKRLYLEPPNGGAMKAFCARHRVTRQWVHRRARDLGLSMPRRVRAGPWADAEIEILAQYDGRSPESASKALARAGFKRTPISCSERLRQIGMEIRDPEAYSAHELAQVMGIDDHAVARWINNCGLKASYRDDIGNGRWSIKRTDLRAWLIRSAEWDHRRCQREWLVEILAGRVGLTVDEAKACG